MFSSSDSRSERGMGSVETTTHIPNDGSLTLTSSTSGQSLFASLLKGEPPTVTHGSGVFPASHDMDTKEKIIFGKPSIFAFSNATGGVTPDVTPFQVKNISIGLSSRPSTTTVVTVPSSQSLSLAKSQVSLKNSVEPASDPTVSLFSSSPVFPLAKENAPSLLLAPKVPVTKIETGFSFAETFKKETMDKCSITDEPQLEQKGSGIFGKPPSFSFSSAAANMMSDNKVSDQSSSVGTAFRGSSSSLPPVNDSECRKGGHKAGSETSRRKYSNKASPTTTTNKTSSGIATSKISPQLTSSKSSPRMAVSRASPEIVCTRSTSGTSSGRSSDWTASEVSSVDASSNSTNRHWDSPGSFSAPRHLVKDFGSSLVKKIKHRNEVSTKIRKKSKDDESKADIRSSGLLTPEEIHKLKSIVCKGIPPDLNNRSDLIKHFSKFGQIEKVSCSIRHKHAVVTFATHQAARKAKKLGSIISPNSKPVEIFWHTHTSKSSDEKKPLFQSEVHEELDSMMEIDTHDVLDRPAEHQPYKSPKISTSPRKRSEKSKSDLKDSKHSEKVKSSIIGDSNEDSLKMLLEKPAFTEEDKYHVLNARDKLMRLSLQKQSDISKAKAVVGTCPDMCSEKERYSRFEKKGLSLYEQKKTFDPSVTVKCLDHRIIIKEYSRSSADKEEPLPHEIRPTHVLSLTMDHLMCNVANRVTDSSLSVGEWYDFIWNRTRAIRKDIAQQDLCSIDCVKLVEKCVRFHIHCAATLCEEDMAVFDPKINDENLTKSLQTLKHMYHDLSLNGIKCPNEAEFRAYDILLSLNEGDTLRQAQNFTSEIRVSPEVRFAVSAAFAMNSNNYSRFFKLVEEASYLNACIMHRYFTPVRVKALCVMLKAYCLPNHVEMYPLEELVKVFKFESVEEASQFCQWLGFQTNESHVQLDRTSFVTPSSSAFVTRSINLVEKKRNVSVGEVMNKGPLPVNPLVSYEPHCSFDCECYLNKEAFDASDQKFKSQQGNETVKITIIQPKLMPEENQVVAQAGAVTMESETPVDSSPKRKSATDRYLAIDTSQLHSSPTSKAAEAKRASSYKALSIGTPASTASKEKNSVCNKDQIFQSSRNVAQERILPPAIQKKVFPPASQKKVFPSAGLNRVEIMQYASDMWEQLSLEVIENYAHEVATREHETEIVCIRLRDSLIRGVVKDLCFETSCDVIRDVTKEEIAAYEIEKQKEDCVNSLAEEMILETVQEHVSDFVEQEYVEARAQLLDVACRSVVRTVFESCVTKLMTSVAKEVHNEEKKTWKNSVKSAKRKTQLQQAKKALSKWRKMYRKRRKLEICRDTFPCSPQIPLKMNSAVSDCESVLFKFKKEKKLSQLLDAGVLLSSIKQEFSWLPLDLSRLFEKHFPKSEAAYSPGLKRMCWKLLLLIPENCGDTDDNSWTSFVRWFCAKFCREKLENSFRDGTILYNLFEKKCHGYHADICVRAVLLGSRDFLQNLEVMKKKRLLEGTSAVFLLMPYYKMNDMIHKEILNQVQEVFHIKHPSRPVPLYCFLVGSNVFHTPPTITHFLNSLIKKFVLSDYKVFSVEDASQHWMLSEELLKATAWLIEQYNEVPALLSCSLKDFVEDWFLKIFSIIYENISHVASPIKAQNPLKMILYYNSIIGDCTEAVCSSDLSNISWPPPEMIRYGHMSEAALGWNELENLSKVRTILANIHLPEFKGSSVSLDDLWMYVREVAAIGGSNSCNLFSSIKSFLLKSEQFIANNNFIPWSDVVYDCAHYLMSCQSFMDESTKKELQVTYVSEDLDNINMKLKWKDIPQGEEEVINEQSGFIKKRKHCPERIHKSLQPGDAYLSDILEHSALKYARTENPDQGIAFKQSFMAGRKPSRTFTYQQSSNSLMSTSLCDTERKSFLLMEAVAAEKCQSEFYLAHLEAKVAEGQCINEGTLDDTFLDEDYDDGIEASCSQSSSTSDFNPKEEFSVLCTTTDLNGSFKELKDRLTAQQKASEAHERQLRQFM